MKAVDDAFTPMRFLMAMVLIVAMIFPDVLMSGSSFFYRDFGLFGYPLATMHQNAFWAGEVPLWNPYSSCGLPFLAQWNTMVFYPGSLIYLLLPLPWSLNLFCLAHLILAGMTMYLLAHAWTHTRLAATVAGLGYAFNGLMLHSLMWPNNIAALAWMPLVILLVERAWRRGGRWIYWAAIVAAIQTLSGGPEIILFTWMILVSWWLVHACWRFRRMGFVAGVLQNLSLRICAVGSLVAGLTAIQMLPFARLFSLSQRDTSFGDSAWSMPGWGWANFLVPLFHSTPSLAGVYSQDAQQWTSSYYMGIGVLALSLLALVSSQSRLRPRVYFLGGVLLFGLMMTLGDNGVFYTWLKAVFPAIGFARFPVKFVVLAVWALPVLSAFGIRCLVRSHRLEALANSRRIVSITGGMLVLIGFLIWFAGAYPVPDESVSTTMFSGLSRGGILILFCFLLTYLVRHRSGPQYIASAGLICVLVVVDAITHTPRQNPTVSARALEPRAVTAHSLPGLGEARAMLSPNVRNIMTHVGHPDPEQHTRGYRKVVCPNWNLIDQVPLVDGFFSLYHGKWEEIWNLLYSGQDTYPEPLVDFLGVSRISSDNQLFSWENRSSAMPLITGGQRPIFLNQTETLKRLASTDFTPKSEVLLPEEARSELDTVSHGGVKVISSHHSYSKLNVTVEADNQALLVLSQTHNPNWKAWVNENPTEVWAANHAFQAISIPAGRSSVQWVYQDWDYRAGAMVSSIFWLGCLWGGATAKRMRFNL